MLAADKLQLQSALKQQAVALKEKEFNLHHSNLMTVGTQAAVLAGLDITMFIEFAPAPVTEWAEEYQSVAHYLKIVYYGIIVAAFCANMIVVAHTTALSVLGAGLALRGPDGSMMVASDGLYEERRSVFQTFGIGLACTVGSVLVSVWMMLPWQPAAVCWVVALLACRKILVNYRRVVHRFGFDERDTVDLRDIMESPALASLGKSLMNHLSAAAASATGAGTATGSAFQQQQHQQQQQQQASSSSSSSSAWRLFGRNNTSSIDQTLSKHSDGLHYERRYRQQSRSRSRHNHHEWDGHSFHDEYDLEMQTENNNDLLIPLSSAMSTASSGGGGSVGGGNNATHRKTTTTTVSHATHRRRPPAAQSRSNSRSPTHAVKIV